MLLQFKNNVTIKEIPSIITKQMSYKSKEETKLLYKDTLRT